MTDPQQQPQQPQAGASGFPPAAPFGTPTEGRDSAWSRPVGEGAVPGAGAAGPRRGWGRPEQATGREPYEAPDDGEPTRQMPRIEEVGADDATQQVPRVEGPAESWHGRRGVEPAEPAEDSGHRTEQLSRVEALAPGARRYAEPTERRPRRSRAPWVAVALVLLVVAGVLGWRYVQGQRFDQRLAADTAAARQVVEDYYAALGDGDARAALATASDRPQENSLLTDEVLRSAQQAAPIRGLTVDRVDLASDATKRMVGDAGTVAVRYRMGDTPVQVEVPVNREAGGWRITSATSRVDLGAEGRRVNGQPAGSEAVEVFPGSYTVTTPSPYVKLDKPQLLVTIPDPMGTQGQQWAGGKASLTPQGREAVLAAARESLTSCLAQKSLTPEGCPIAIETGPEITIEADTIRYSLVGSPWQDAKVDLENDTRARGTIKLAYRIDAAAKSKGVEGVVRQSYEQETSFLADLTAEKPAITWQ